MIDLFVVYEIFEHGNWISKTAKGTFDNRPDAVCLKYDLQEANDRPLNTRYAVEKLNLTIPQVEEGTGM